MLPLWWYDGEDFSWGLRLALQVFLGSPPNVQVLGLLRFVIVQLRHRLTEDGLSD